jgi:sugar lactone lactonase YvrE
LRTSTGALYRIDAEGKATELYDGVQLSNGIGFSPGERLLYHADSAARAIRVFEIPDHGAAILHRTLAMTGNPEGEAPLHGLREVRSPSSTRTSRAPAPSSRRARC